MNHKGSSSVSDHGGCSLYMSVCCHLYFGRSDADLASHWHECWFLNRQQNQEMQKQCPFRNNATSCFDVSKEIIFYFWSERKYFHKSLWCPNPCPAPGSMQLCGGWDSSFLICPLCPDTRDLLLRDFLRTRLWEQKSECSCSCSLQQFNNYSSRKKPLSTPTLWTMFSIDSATSEPCVSTAHVCW